MRLDLSAIKIALSEVEDAVAGPRTEIRVSETADFSRFYHFHQLIQAGYVDAIDTTTLAARSYIVQDLTWAGHELLKKMRNDGVWSKAKAKVIELGGDVPIRVLEKILDAGWDALPI